MLSFTKHYKEQLNVTNILLSRGKTIVKLSAITALHHQRGATMVHLKGGKFIEIPQSIEDHHQLLEEYTTKLQTTLPNL